MNRLSMADIAKDVAGYHGMSVPELLTKTSRRHVSHPRHEFMWRAYKLPHISLPQIASFLGMKDHTSVLYGVRAHHKRELQARWVRS